MSKSIQRSVSKIHQYRKVLLETHAKIMNEASSMRKECWDAFVSSWNEHGFEGRPDMSSFAFQGGIVGQNPWEPGTFMVFGNESCEKGFLKKVAKVAPDFYKKTGVSLSTPNLKGRFCQFPKPKRSRKK